MAASAAFATAPPFSARKKVKINQGIASIALAMASHPAPLNLLRVTAPPLPASGFSSPPPQLIRRHTLCRRVSPGRRDEASVPGAVPRFRLPAPGRRRSGVLPHRRKKPHRPPSGSCRALCSHRLSSSESPSRVHRAPYMHHVTRSCFYHDFLLKVERFFTKGVIHMITTSDFKRGLVIQD